MRTWCKALLVFLGLFCLGSNLDAASPEAEFERANLLYDQAKFREAADAYMQLVREGEASMAVYFNLGNALFKSGQLGRAIAAYRLVEANRPRDPDVRANLRFALAQVQGPSFEDPYLLQWIRRLSLNEWTALTTLGFWAAMILLALGQWRPRLRTGASRYAMVASLFTLFCGACLAISAYQAFSVPRAIVIAPEASVLRGPIEESETVFTVHDGAELRVLDVRNEWGQVTAGQGRSGWIKLAQVQTNARPKASGR
jgi:tetratricopeptide (TPR) repeat protein